MDKISPIRLYDENKTIAGFHLRQLLFKQGRHTYVRTVMESLFKLYNEGKIKPIIDSVWAFEDVSLHKISEVDIQLKKLVLKTKMLCIYYYF